MPVKTYKTADEIPEAARDTAVETKDGAFLVFEEEDVSAVKDALDKERARADAAEKAANKTAKALQKAELEAKQKASGLSDEQIAALRADVRKEVEAEFAPLQEKATLAETLAAENRSLLLDNRIKAQMATAGVRAERIEPFFRVISDRFDLTDDKTPMLKGKPGVDVKGYLADALKQEFPEFYVGTMAAGSDAPGSSGVRGTPAPDPGLSPIERITLARQQGKAA